MKLDHHEEFFREQLKKYHPDVDTNDLWSQIQPHIVSTKRKKRSFLYWYFIGLLVLLSAVSYSWWMMSDTPPTTSPGAIPTAELSTRRVEDFSENHDQPVAEPKITEKRISLQSTQPDPDEVQISTPSFPQNMNNNFENPATASQKLTGAARFDDHETFYIKGSVDNLLEGTNLNSSSNFKSVNATFEQPDLALASAGATFPVTGSLAFKRPTVSPNSGETALSRAPVIPIDNNDPGRNHSKLSVTASVGYGQYQSQNISSDYAIPVSNQGLQDLTPGPATKPNGMFTALAGVEYWLGKSFYLQSGLMYTQLQSDARLRNVYEFQAIENGETNTFYSDNPENVEITSVVEITNLDRTDVQSHAQRYFLDIPLKIGYEKRIGRLGLGVHAGIAINIMSRQSGSYLTTANRILQVGEKRSETTDQGPGLTYLGGVDINYHLSPRWSVGVSPFGRLLQDTGSLSGENENILAYGVNLGVKFRI